MQRPARQIGAMQRQGEVIRSEERPVVAIELKFVGLAPVIEARLYLHPEAHRPAHHAHQPNQPVAIGCLALDDRHEIDHLAHPSEVMNRVIRIAVSGKYSCRLT